MKSTSAWVLASCLLVACGGDDTTSGGSGGSTSGAGGSTTGAGGTSTGAGGSSTGAGGSTGTSGGSATGGSGGTTTGTGGAIGTGGGGGAGGGAMMGGPADEMLCGAVQLTASKTIAAGKVTAVCAGATITVAAGVGITIQGTLRLDGAAGMPAIFKSATGGSMGWQGLAIAKGGSLQGSYGEIHDAATAINAAAGSDFNIDHIVIDNSTIVGMINSGGTINHAVIHGLGAKQPDDLIFIGSASPHLLNTSIDQGGGRDYIQVNGATSAPVFDHMDLTGAHCAFHFNGGNGTTISNSNVHANAFGLMIEGSVGTKITHNNFTDNKPAFGDCAGGSAVISDNFVNGTALGGTPTCTGKLMMMTPAAAAYPLMGAGAVGPQP